MSDEYQIPVPPSFQALYVDRRQRLTVPVAELRERSEFCEDLALQLMERAQALQFDLGLSEDLVLERMHAGLCEADGIVSPPEAGWVIRRLAELLDWPALELPPPAA
jgi:hypothetical protein